MFLLSLTILCASPHKPVGLSCFFLIPLTAVLGSLVLYVPSSPVLVTIIMLSSPFSVSSRVPLLSKSLNSLFFISCWRCHLLPSHCGLGVWFNVLHLGWKGCGVTKIKTDTAGAINPPPTTTHRVKNYCCFIIFWRLFFSFPLCLVTEALFLFQCLGFHLVLLRLSLLLHLGHFFPPSLP